jgi:hypothetical protein
VRFNQYMPKQIQAPSAICGLNSLPSLLFSAAGKLAGRWGALHCLALLLLSGPPVKAKGGEFLIAPVKQSVATPGAGTAKGAAIGAKVLVAPVAYVHTSPILLNTYADTQLVVPLSATDADAGSSIVSYNVTTLPPAAAGVLKINGTAITTTSVIGAADAGNLTFDPVAGYFGTAVFQYRAKDNTGTYSASVGYGIPVSKATCGAGAGQANLLSYYARTDGEDWQVPRTVSVGGVAVTASGYATSAGTASSLAIAEQA